MVIDLKSRSRYLEDVKTRTLVDGMKDSIIAALQNAPKSDANKEVLELVVSHKDDKSTATMLEKIGKALVLIYKNIPKQIALPKIFQIKGEVDIGNIADVKVQNLQEIEKYFRLLEQRIAQLASAISSVPQPKIEMPRMEFPKELFRPTSDNSAILEALQGLEKALEKISKQKIEIPRTVSVDNFPAQLVPHPVTHMSINALQGFIKTTAATVGTSLVKLPTYGVLANRRSIYVYNNSSNTIYVGGSDVTTTNGIPVPTNSTSPIIDAGVNTVFYGIASTTGNDIRVMEVSDENSGR